MTTLAVCSRPSGSLEARNGAAIASPKNATDPANANFVVLTFYVILPGLCRDAL